jgi:DNA-binding NarL/FixJ family response regulator
MAENAPRLLLVDDDGGIRQALRNLLEDEGMDVVGEAGDGAEGVERAKELSPDVILMDMRMPGMGGIEATKLIKDVLPTTQIVILSVYDDQVLLQDASQAGAFAYLVKGCSAKTIRETIHKAHALKHDLDVGSSGNGAAEEPSIEPG